MNIRLSSSTQVLRAELIGDNQCHCPSAGIFVCGATPVIELCLQLLRAGYSPTLRLECFRGDTLILVADPIGEMAEFRIEPAVAQLA